VAAGIAGVAPGFVGDAARLAAPVAGGLPSALVAVLAVLAEEVLLVVLLAVLLAVLRVTIASSIDLRSLEHERAPRPYTVVNDFAA
jgi:hypothetical protein